MRPPRYHILSVEEGTLPLAGWDLSSSEDVLARLGRSRKVRNVLLNHRGKLEVRGGVSGYAALTNIALQTQLWANPTDPTKLLFGRTDNTFQRVTMPTPFTGSGVSMGATFAAPAGITAARLGWSTTLGAYTYGMSAQTAAFAFTRWDGTEATANLVKYANAPTPVAIGTYSFEGCGATHLQRVFVGGCTPAGAAASSSDVVTLTWSIVGGPTTDALSSWQDPVSGLTNKIVLDDITDKIVNLISWNGRLYILRERSIWALYGTSPANFSVRKVSDMGAGNKFFDSGVALGGTAAPRIAALQDSLYYANNKGLFRFDGARSVCVSNALDTLTDFYPNPLRNSFVLIPLSPTDLYLNNSNVSAVYNAPTGTWFELTIGGNTHWPSMTTGGRSGDTPWAVDNAGITPLDTVLSGAANTNGCDIGDLTGTTRTAIDVSVKSAMFQLGSPGRNAYIHRLRVDYYLTAVQQSLFPGRGIPGLTVFILDDTNNILWQHTEPGNLESSNTRLRKVYDVGVEASGGVTIQIDVTASGTNGTLAAIGHFELLNVEIEFAHAQDRTG